MENQLAEIIVLWAYKKVSFDLCLISDLVPLGAGLQCHGEPKKRVAAGEPMEAAFSSDGLGSLFGGGGGGFLCKIYCF